MLILRFNYTNFSHLNSKRNLEDLFYKIEMPFDEGFGKMELAEFPLMKIG